MQRTSFAAAALSALCILGCTGAPAPDGPLHLTVLTADACGQWQGLASFPSHPTPWELVVSGRGGDVAVEIPANATEWTVSGPGAPGATSVVSLGNAVGASSEPTTIAFPAASAGISAPSRFAGHAEGAVPPLNVKVLAGCDPSGFRVTATVEPEGRVLLDHGVPSPSGALSIPMATVPQGAHMITLVVLSGDNQLAKKRVSVAIGPPCEDRDNDGVDACDGDCNDNDPAIKPGAVDHLGDGIDNDCDGVNGTDKDGDGQEAKSAGGTDCDDDNPLVFGGQTSRPDRDLDGFYSWDRLDWNCDGIVDTNPGRRDCDDFNPNVPQVAEHPIPNGVDDNCDGRIDEGTRAYDDDGDGQSEDQGDCNDADNTVFLGASELGDCKDNDCDGTVDEGATRRTVADAYEPNDTTAFELSGATKHPTFLGFGTGYRPTAETVSLITRDGSDVERFSVWTHDGNLDSWNVAVSATSIGDGLRYDVVIQGNGDTQRGVLEGAGDKVEMLGTVNRDNSGTYMITVTPAEPALTHCPVVLHITSG